MKKEIRDVDVKRGIVQCTTSDERWYLKPSKNIKTRLPTYTPVPSVTWITNYYWKSPHLTKWIADKGYDEAEVLKKAAGERGSRVHLAIEMILKGEEFRIDTKVPNKTTGEMQELSYDELLCVKGFLDWQAAVKPEIIAIEIVVFSKIHGYAGTVDLVCRIDGVPWVVDFKTGKSVYREYELQVSAYRMALENGENPLYEKVQTGTLGGDPYYEDKMVDMSGCKTAILQVGYDRNKAGYKFTEVDDAFALFKVAQLIWATETGDSTPGFTQKDFPIVLSPVKSNSHPRE